MQTKKKTIENVILRLKVEIGKLTRIIQENARQVNALSNGTRTLRKERAVLTDLIRELTPKPGVSNGK